MDKTSALACGMITKLVSLHLNYICVLPVESRDFGFGLEVMDKTSALACGMITKLVSLHLNYICVLPVESNLIM